LEDDSDEEKAEGVLPECSKTDAVSFEKINTDQKFTQPPARFSEASLIKELEEKGIGRPSTYASIVSTVQDRGYVEKDAGQLRPAELGRVVNELLIGSFADIMNVEFTAGMEDKLDGVEKGDTDWVAVLKAFYKDFAKDLETAEANMRDVKREETATDVICPACGEKMIIKWGRMGQFLACPKYPDCKTTRNFTKHDDGDIQIAKTETTDQKCPECGGPMLVKQGRFGNLLPVQITLSVKGQNLLPQALNAQYVAKAKCQRSVQRKEKYFIAVVNIQNVNSQYGISLLIGLALRAGLN